jgi:hypothetical protein
MKTNIKNIMFNMTAAALFASTVGCLSFSEKTSSNSDDFASGNKLTLPLAETEADPCDELAACESEILRIKQRMASGKMVEGEVLGTLYSLHSLMARKDFLVKNIALMNSPAGQ